ncbi:SRPBCC family protein [Domibacillus indicus]|uniref:SRPBCC family protein n=1 Tax=Domibacillus indicus TaxID=1437523 RepID=UPI000617FEA2|nr:SRPBCC family protein [Domibacillus indicus]
MQEFKKITVEAIVEAPVEKVWRYWAEPDHITKWNNASDDWHTPFAENDLREGGTFVSRMEAKDGSAGFDFGGIYDEVKLHEIIAYSMSDGRKVKITFKNLGNQTEVMETFDAEPTHPVEYQQQGWQAILNNFKKYAEETNNS